MKTFVLVSALLLSVQLQAQAPAVEPAPATGQAEMPEPMITLTPGKTDVKLKSAHHTNKDLAMAELKKCYDQTVAEAAAQNLSIPVGKVVVDFSFDSEGTVTQFQFKENRVRPASAALNGCIETSIRQTKFEKLQNQKKGKVVNVFYPYIFENKKSVKQ
ncbi:hypothetical protein EZJ49_07605 [Bdellovibrio bacteriovorus]|uniref:hypothetical protein n=1 Tax=Bdellovibrio bacteriovorus TaxID=959 RepID=UPI0021CE7767|nr:hypothetical protein [Bdellovibrio bacteriovorus]UXR66113.1 hypothetical protein EZJ49_07605 [Bdellovibrio bacteriovorus]